MSDLAAAAAFRYCRLEKDGAILIIIIERPEVLNALNEEAHFELNRAFDLYAAATDLRVAIITGAGERAFAWAPTSRRSRYAETMHIRREASGESPSASTFGSR